MNYEMRTAYCSYIKYTFWAYVWEAPEFLSMSKTLLRKLWSKKQFGYFELACS
jgi:hypothetical protein